MSTFLALRLISEKMPTRRIAIKLSYDGTGYHGWQRQPQLEQTIQGTLEHHLSTLLKESVLVDGASRTDAGVHAEDQLGAFTTSHPIQVNGLIKAINRRLPSQIAVTHAYEVDSAFTPRFVNQGKRYRYRLYYSPTRLPMIDRFSTRIHYPLDLEALCRGLSHIVGEHDFKSFAASNGQHQSSIRHIWHASLTKYKIAENGMLYEIRFEGSGFLKQMVRNLVGTLIEIGRGQWSSDRIPLIIEAKNRIAAGPTAAPRGLCLETMFWHPPKDMTS
jgi:tRNA pseudouridine38-40 synthase